MVIAVLVESRYVLDIDIEFTSLSCVDFHVTTGLIYDSIIFDVFPLRLDRPTL